MKYKNMQFREEDFAEIARLAKLLSEKNEIDVGYVQTVMHAVKRTIKELEPKK